MGILLGTSLALFANLTLAQANPAADHYKAGVAHFRAGQFAEAIQEFRAADAIRPSAVLSFDIAQCYEKMADLPNAKLAYQDYLRRAPNADDRQAVEATIASIDQKLAQQQQPRETVVLVPATVPPGAPPEAQPGIQASASKPSRNLTLGLTVASIGAAGVIAGIIMNGLSHNASLSLQNDGAIVDEAPRYWSQSTAQGYYNTAQNLWTGALIGYIAGGVLLATGGGILTYELASSPGDHTMTSLRRGTILLTVAITAPLWGCPPNLTGESCNNDCACPTSQTCVGLPDGGAGGTCQDGVNACANLTDGGAGDGGQAAFAGTVTLNGGAKPVSGAGVYGFADGTPRANGNGVYTTADLSGTVGNQGSFSFPEPVPAATGSGYQFVAVYDTRARGDFSIIDPAVFNRFSRDSLVPASTQATSLTIDVETSTCYSVTADFQQDNGGRGITYLVGVGAVAYDINTGALLTAPGDFDQASANFDAGSALPPGFVPLGSLPLSPVGSVPGSPVSNSWVYIPPRPVELSNTGTFEFSLSDSAHATVQYPAGTCSVSYAPAPGFPSNLTLDGQSSNAIWQPGSGSSGGSVMVAWTDAQVTDPNFTFLGNLISIVDQDQNQLLPDAGTVTSPLRLSVNVVPLFDCPDRGNKFCTLEITSLYLDTRKSRSVPYEGGTTYITFQRSTSGG